MILAIAFAHVWGVIQLVAVGSSSRTVRVRTVLAALAVGLYAIGPLTVFLQLQWIHFAASLLGTPVAHMQGIASYTVDPFLEEALKLLPVAMLLLLIPAVRRQWSVMDCVLIAAGTGSGYGLAENLYRYAGSPDSAHAITGGWAIIIGRHTLLVPGILHTLTSWLPAGTVPADETIGVNSHLVWSAIGGLAVGLIARHRTSAARWVAGGLFLYIGLDHAAGNATLSSGSWLSPLVAPLHALATLGGFMAAAALVAAWWLDRTSRPTADVLDTLLAAERSVSPRISGTFKAAVSRLPWSIFWVGAYTRARRAYHAAHAGEPAGPDALLMAVVAQREHVDRQLAEAKSPGLLPSGVSLAAVRSALRRPAVILSLVLLAPSVFFLAIGGFPQAAGIQAAMRGPFVWPLVLLITVLAQSRMAWSVIVGVRSWPKTTRLPMADDAAIVGLQLACGVGAVGLAGFTMMRVLGGVSAGSSLILSAHGADAANRLDPDGALSLSNGAGPVVSSGDPDGEVNADTGPAGSEAPPVGDAENAANLGAETGNDLGESLGTDVDADSDFPAPPKKRPLPAPPKPSPDDVAAQAEARAAKAEADALEAGHLRQNAIRAQDAADIAKATGAGDDPFVESPGANDVDGAKGGVAVADNDMNDANLKAAEAREAANSAREEANKARAAAARAADPLGTAADNADKDYAAAKAREDEAFQKPAAKPYHDARQAAMLAKEKADEARAAANAAKDARSASVIGVDKP